MEDERLTVITEIVRRCAERQYNLGKIQLQKMVYFFQEKGKDLGYTYVIFHYGPFSFELAEDIERLKTLRVLNIEPDDAGYGYHITPGVHSNVFTTNDSVINANTHALDTIIDTLGMMTASEIELVATIHYVFSVLRETNQGDIREDVIRSVAELKPQFNSEQIAHALANMPAAFMPS